MSKTFEQLAEEQHKADQKTSQMGRDAEALLANPAWDVTWSWLRTSMLEAWATSDLRDEDAQAILLMQVKSLDKLKRQFVALVQAGAAVDDETRRRIIAEQEKEENVFARGARALRMRRG